MDELRIYAHNKMLAARSVETIVNSVKYIFCWRICDPETVRKFIRESDVQGLTKYLDSIVEKNTVPKTIKELRNTAKQLGIPYYTSLNRSRLIGAIENAEAIKKPVVQVPLDQQGQT